MSDDSDRALAQPEEPKNAFDKIGEWIDAFPGNAEVFQFRYEGAVVTAHKVIGAVVFQQGPVQVKIVYSDRSPNSRAIDLTISEFDNAFEHTKLEESGDLPAQLQTPVAKLAMALIEAYKTDSAKEHVEGSLVDALRTSVKARLVAALGESLVEVNAA